MPDKHKEFWQWFADHESEFFNVDAENKMEREHLFDDMAVELQNINPDLTFEFGPSSEKREFVISAGGIRRAFPEVVSLTKAAPHLERWIIIAFRPRRPVPEAIVLGDQQISADTITFSLLDNGKMAGIRLFIPGYREKDSDLTQLGYLLLDNMLGEYDVETRLGLIEMLPSNSKISGDRYPISQLPGLFDNLVTRLEGRTRKPS